MNDDPIFNRKVSTAKSIRATDWSQFSELGEILFNVPDETIRIQDSIRRLKADPNIQGNDEKVKELKKQAFSFTPSGVFVGNRIKNNMAYYSGLVSIDFDAKDNTHLEHFKDIQPFDFGVLPFVCFASRSISGEGFFLLARLTDDPLIFDRQIKSLLSEITSLGIAPDASCKDITRCRILSYDPEHYFNADAIPYTGIDANKRSSQFQGKPQQLVNVGKFSMSEAEKVERLVRLVCSARVDIAPNYRDWFKIACSIAGTFGVHGIDSFVLLSQFHPDFDHLKAEKQYNEALKHQGYSYKLGTLFHYAKLAGINV